MAGWQALVEAVPVWWRGVVVLCRAIHGWAASSGGGGGCGRAVAVVGSSGVTVT